MTHKAKNFFAALIEKTTFGNKLMDTLFSLVCINTFLAGMSFITTLLIANILGKEHFGDFSYAIAVGGYCSTIAFCGLERTLIRDLVHFPERFDEYTSASIVLRISMLIIGFVLILGMNFMAKEGNRMGIAGAFIVLSQGIQALQLAPVYDAWSKMKRHALYLLAERCLYFASVWTFVLLFKDSLSVSLLALFMMLSVILGIYLQYSWASFRISIKFNYNIILLAANMLKKNLWVWSAVLATLSFGGLSKIILKHVSGSGELGAYSVAWQVVPLGSILITQIGRIGNPRIARIVQNSISQQQRIRFILKYTFLSTLAGIVVGAPAIFFPEYILQIFRPEYAAAATSLRIFGFYVIIIGMGQVAAQYLVAARKESAYSVIVIFTGGLSLFLYYLCIPQWAGAGAALAVLISHGFAIILYLVVMSYYILTSSKTLTATPSQ